MASGQKNIFPGKGWYSCGLQRISADHMTLGLIVLDFRAKCCGFFFLPKQIFKGLDRILDFNLWALGKQERCFAKLPRSCHESTRLPQEATA